MTRLSEIDLSANGVQINFAEGTKLYVEDPCFFIRYFPSFAPLLLPNHVYSYHATIILCKSCSAHPRFCCHLQQKSGILVWFDLQDA